MEVLVAVDHNNSLVEWELQVKAMEVDLVVIIIIMVIFFMVAVAVEEEEHPLRIKVVLDSQIVLQEHLCHIQLVVLVEVKIQPVVPPHF